MHKDLTPQKLRQLAETALATYLLRISDATQFSADLAPRLVGCSCDPVQLEMAFDTKPWMTNPTGVLHGGVVATFLDNAMGLSCSCLCDCRHTPTISMTVHYARPTPLNTTIHIKTQMVMFGRTSSQLSAQLYLPQEPDRVLVFASGVYSTKPTPSQP